MHTKLINGRLYSVQRSEDVPMRTVPDFSKSKRAEDHLKKAKLNYKASKDNTSIFNEKQNNLINQILTSPTPDWGSIVVKV